MNILLNEALAADIDPDAFTWYRFKRKTKMTFDQRYNQRHELVLMPGDIFGMLKTKKQVFQLIKRDTQHILHRNILPSTHTKILAASEPYKAKVEKAQKNLGAIRATRVSTKVRPTLKRTDNYFKPNHTVIERNSIDYADYQWRRTVVRTRVESKRHERTKHILVKDEEFGLRYVNKSFGGYILFRDTNRVLISSELFDELLDNSRVLPLAKQREGTIDVRERVAAIITKAPPPPRTAVLETVEEQHSVKSKYDFDSLDTDSLIQKSSRRRDNQVRRTQRALNTVYKVADTPHVVGDDEELFDPEDEHDVHDGPTIEPVRHDVREIEIPDEELEEDEPVSEDRAPEPVQDYEIADELVPGRMFSIRDRQFVVVMAGIMERNANLMEYLIYEIENDDEEMTLYRLRMQSNFLYSQFSKHATLLDGEYDEAELRYLQDRVDYAVYKQIPLVR